MRWIISHRADQEARVMADRHYNRQKIGTKQFVPPGRCLVLKQSAAFWITSWPFAEYVKHRWAGAWVCSAYRKEHRDRDASEDIREALACTRFKYPDVPELGMVTFISRKHVAPIVRRGVKTWGYSWLKAGFEPDGETKGGLLAFRIRPENMPPAEKWMDDDFAG